MLEALAYLELTEKYLDPEFEILSSLQYQDWDERTVGELDLIVWNRKEREAVLVFEVRLSPNFECARILAEKQLNRCSKHPLPGGQRDHCRCHDSAEPCQMK